MWPMALIFWHYVKYFCLPFALRNTNWLGFFKSQSPIYFVKIRPSDFLCNEFLIKMYGFLQNYTFKICTLSKIMNICWKYNIFYWYNVGVYLQDTWFRTHIHWFVTVFWHVFHVHCLYQNVFKSMPANIVSWLRKKCLCLIIDRVGLLYDECP